MPPQAIPIDPRSGPDVVVVSGPSSPAFAKNAAPVPVPSRCEQAAALLEKAVQGSNPDPSIAYMLALAYKRLGKTTEARSALRKIAKPDANVVLQMGLLSLAENNLVGAEEELTRAWSMDSSSYEICCNLFLTQLTLGKVEPCLELIPCAIKLLDQRNGAGNYLAGPDEDRHFLQVLYTLLKACRTLEGYGKAEALLAELQPTDEQRLLRVIRSLGQLDTAHTLLRVLSEARPRSAAVREAFVETVLVKGKTLIDRCLWTEAELLLRPLARERAFSRTSQITLYNLLGCCSCLTQDFDGALKSFSAALKLSPNDVRLEQNIALTYELQGDLTAAEPHWGRYFDLLGDQVPAPAELPNYLARLSYEGLIRLSSRYSEKEKWPVAISYMQRAVQLRGDEPECLEQLFYLYKQAKRYSDARRTLEQLRRLRPNDPQYDLFELDLIEVKGLNDIDKILSEIDRMRKRYPGDARIEDRAMKMVSDVIPMMGNLCDRLSERLSMIIDQIRHLPNHQINWSAVNEEMRDLLKEFQKLRRITAKCLPLVNSDEQRRVIRELSDHIDKKMEACRTVGT